MLKNPFDTTKARLTAHRTPDALYAAKDFAPNDRLVAKNQETLGVGADLVSADDGTADRDGSTAVGEMDFGGIFLDERTKCSVGDFAATILFVDGSSVNNRHALYCIQ
jgi:hypothetical protein